jgi:hypothetical protein
MLRVRPGVLLVRASFVPTSALINLDFRSQKESPLHQLDNAANLNVVISLPVSR